MYISVPKDFLNDIEPKLIFNLTKRQLVCFSLGIIAGLPMFFLIKDFNATLGTLAMMLTASPFFVAGIFKKNNHRLEVIVKQIYNVKFGGKPKKRLFKTNNYYLQLEKQQTLNNEILYILKNRRKKRRKPFENKHKKVKQDKKKKGI